MTISVCMGIYNGERFIEKQLQSILEQSVAPDEVILCDDGSADTTVAIVERFIQRNGLDASWKLYKNAENKGYPGNFYYAMSLCSGELVFLADQDDLWKKNKIEKMMAIMHEHAEIKLLSSKWGIMDAQDTILKKVSTGKSDEEENYRLITVQDILYYYDWPGMSMCYRNDWGKEVLTKIGKSQAPHDMAMAIVAAEQEGFYCVNQVYQYHRRHEVNVAMEEHRIRKLLNKKRKLYEIDNYLEKMKQILDCECLCKEESLQLVHRKKTLMQERFDNLAKGCRGRIVKQYRENRKEIRLATMLCDWLICGKNTGRE